MSKVLSVKELLTGDHGLYDKWLNKQYFGLPVVVYLCVLHVHSLQSPPKPAPPLEYKITLWLPGLSQCRMVKNNLTESFHRQSQDGRKFQCVKLLDHEDDTRLLVQGVNGCNMNVTIRLYPSQQEFLRVVGVTDLMIVLHLTPQLKPTCTLSDVRRSSDLLHLLECIESAPLIEMTMSMLPEGTSVIYVSSFDHVYVHALLLDTN